MSFAPISVLPAANQEWAQATGTATAGGVATVPFAASILRKVIAVQVQVPAAAVKKQGWLNFQIGQSPTYIGPNQQPFTPPWSDGVTNICPVENPTAASLNVVVSNLDAAGTCTVFVLYETQPCNC